MSKCPRCSTRKAKRFCPALGESICSLCCGKLREKEIHCPPGCTFLSKHRSYQEKRIMERRPETSLRSSPKEGDVLRDERLAWLALHIEAPLKEFAGRQDSFRDKDALLALQYAREKTEKDTGRVFIPGEREKSLDEAGEAILRMMEKCRFQGRIILTGSPRPYSREERLMVLDRIILSARESAGGDFGGKRYLQAVARRFARIQQTDRKARIITVE